MRELSLHILDVIENSIRAGASVVSVAIDEKPEQDLLQISVEDNGPGLNIAPEDALDPFFTTKSGKRTGLGLSLFRAAAEEADGALTVGKSPLGGVAVKASMRLNHLDRRPLGDLAATLSSVVCTNPGLDLWCRFSAGNAQCELKVSDIAAELDSNEKGGLAVARKVSERIREGLGAINAVV